MEEKKLTNEATIDSLKEMAIKFSKDTYVNRVLVNAINLIHRLQEDYSKLKERYVKVLDLNEKVIAEQKAEIERLTKKAAFYYNKCKSYGIECFCDSELDGVEVE